MNSIDSMMGGVKRNNSSVGVSDQLGIGFPLTVHVGDSIDSMNSIDSMMGGVKRNNSSIGVSDELGFGFPLANVSDSIDSMNSIDSITLRCKVVCSGNL